jgi:mannose-6-phosphate isomerase-like protein (cupin superfamily)
MNIRCRPTSISSRARWNCRVTADSRIQYKAGEAYVEALNHQHQLFNKGNVPAKVLVVFVGPTTITAK